MTSTTLERIRLAQDGPSPNYATAVRELAASGKRSHWIWYVLPQLDGLGTSATSGVYALRGTEEAARLLGDETLRSRLVAVARVIAEQLDRGVPLVKLMGSRIDAMKAVSSFTLFDRVARDVAVSGAATPLSVDCAALSEMAARILARAAEQGFARCAFTLQQLGLSSSSGHGDGTPGR